MLHKSKNVSIFNFSLFLSFLTAFSIVSTSICLSLLPHILPKKLSCESKAGGKFAWYLHICLHNWQSLRQWEWERLPKVDISWHSSVLVREIEARRYYLQLEKEKCRRIFLSVPCFRPFRAAVPKERCPIEHGGKFLKYVKKIRFNGGDWIVV